MALDPKSKYIINTTQLTLLKERDVITFNRFLIYGPHKNSLEGKYTKCIQVQYWSNLYYLLVMPFCRGLYHKTSHQWLDVSKYRHEPLGQ